MSNSLSRFISGSDRRFAVKDGAAAPAAYEESMTAKYMRLVNVPSGSSRIHRELLPPDSVYSPIPVLSS